MTKVLAAFCLCLAVASLMGCAPAEDTTDVRAAMEKVQKEDAAKQKAEGTPDNP